MNQMMEACDHQRGGKTENSSLAISRGGIILNTSQGGSGRAISRQRRLGREEGRGGASFQVKEVSHLGRTTREQGANRTGRTLLKRRGPEKGTRDAGRVRFPSERKRKVLIMACARDWRTKYAINRSVLTGIY